MVSGVDMWHDGPSLATEKPRLGDENNAYGSFGFFWKVGGYFMLLCSYKPSYG
jgi:hypothetical protein